MESKKKPVYVDPRLQRLFERHIHRFITSPQLWGTGTHVDRIFLLYGQKGSGMVEAVSELINRFNIVFTSITVTRDPVAMERAWVVPPTTDGGFLPLFVINDAHLLALHRGTMTLVTHQLKRLLGHFGFILAISEDVPDDEHPFWRQFKVRIPMSLPKKDDYAKLIEWHFDRWVAHSGSEVAKGNHSIDYNELANCCDYTTPADVRRFVRRVINHCIDQYPENHIVLTTDYIKEHFMFPLVRSRDLLCISDKDGLAIQNRYDPTGATDASTIAESVARKRVREETKVYLEGDV